MDLLKGTYVRLGDSVKLKRDIITKGEILEKGDRYLVVDIDTEDINTLELLDENTNEFYKVRIRDLVIEFDSKRHGDFIYGKDILDTITMSCGLEKYVPLYDKIVLINVYLHMVKEGLSHYFTDILAKYTDDEYAYAVCVEEYKEKLSEIKSKIEYYIGIEVTDNEINKEACIKALI